MQSKQSAGTALEPVGWLVSGAMLILCLLFSAVALAQTTKSATKSPSDASAPQTAEAQPAATTGEEMPPRGAPLSPQQKTLDTLANLAQMQERLANDIDSHEKQLRNSLSDSEKTELKSQLEQLQSELQQAKGNFQKISTGVDISFNSEGDVQNFNIQQEMLALIEPIVKEMKHMTTDVRKKADLRDEIEVISQRLPNARTAVENLQSFLKLTEDEQLRSYLTKNLNEWQRHLSTLESRLQAAQLQLDRLTSAETSFAEASHSYLKGFFQKRGLYLTQAVLVVFAILLLARLTRKWVLERLPGYHSQHRSFRIRLLDLLHHIITTILCIIGPMVVFYVAEDWVLFSLGVLLLLATGWTLRTAVPRYWEQIRLFLNIGAVREGERIFFEGLPWLVQRINFYTLLENPKADLKLRIPIDDLTDQKSRPMDRDEPWFPCRRDDWVILSDGVRGKVVGLSLEFVELAERGGAHKTYLLPDFLALSPRNLSTNFRLKSTIGISYRHQAQSTTEIIETLAAYLNRRATEEGIIKNVISLRVEFAEAGASSLDLMVLADFDGETAPLYNRMHRAIQRWCVDACSEYGWEIPFPQLTVTLPEAKAAH